MFSNLKTTREFQELKKKYKKRIYFTWSFEKSRLSSDFQEVISFLESILNITIGKLTLGVTRDKIKWDKYWIIVSISNDSPVSIVDNILNTKDYKIEENVFTLYLE